MYTKTTVYLVRHGQTEWNVEHKFQGHHDSPLTELGLKQAQWLGKALRHERIDAAFSSTSGRALRTAECIRGERDIPIMENDDLREINLGIWEGKTQAGVKASDPEQYDYFWNEPGKFGVTGSESFANVGERAVRTLQKIEQQHQGQSVLLVTHTVVVKLLMAFFEGRPLEKLWDPPFIHPACLCKIELNQRTPEIILYGDISHYEEQAKVF